MERLRGQMMSEAFVGSSLGHFERARLLEIQPAVAERRIRDPKVRHVERDAVRAMLVRYHRSRSC